MKLRDGEKWRFNACKKTLAESRAYDPELNQVYGKLLAKVYYRLDGAMQAFFRRVANGETPGFPRVRPRHCFFTLCYPAMYLTLEGNTLILPTGGKGKHKRFPAIRAHLTELPPEGFREVAISRDGRGNYYASFSYRQPEQARRDGNTVAFDLGIKTLATGVTQEGRISHIGGFKGSRWYNKQLDRLRSKRSTCKKKSRRYLHLSKVYKRVSQKKRNRALNRAVYNDWGLYAFVQMLTYKCQLYGKELQFLDVRNTSKQWSGCGNLHAMPLWKRTYQCAECGLVMDRDENSAHNILTRFFARRGPYTQARPECDVLYATQSGVEVMGTSCEGHVQQLNLFEGG